MRKTILGLFMLLLCFAANAQQKDSISVLKKRVDSLQSRLDEKNYTRVPNRDLEDTFKTKVKEEVNGWFSSNLLLGGGILAAIVALIVSVGRRMVAKEINEKLKNDVEEKTNVLSKLFDEHRKTVKEDFAELKIDIYKKLADEQDDIKKYRNQSLETLEKFKTETEGTFNKYVDEKLKLTETKVSNLQEELNETVSPLFNQSVEGILKRANENKGDKIQKDEELIRYLEKLFKKEKLPSEKSAEEALDAIVQYYYYRLNTDKMVSLIRDYGSRYNLSAASYANAALAFVDKYEINNQLEFRNNCLNYCNEAIKKSADYGLAYAIKALIYLIDLQRSFDDEQKTNAVKEINRTFHQMRFIKSEYIAEEFINRIDVYKKIPTFSVYMDLLETDFVNEMLEVRDRAAKKDHGSTVGQDSQSQSSS